MIADDPWGKSNMHTKSGIGYWLFMGWAGCLVLALACIADANIQRLMIGHFSSASLDDTIPYDWEPLGFKNISSHTRYTLVKDNETVVVKAESSASASGLIRKTAINPQEYPVLHWRWKTDRVLDKGDIFSKHGDDYPARLYILFEYDPTGLTMFEKIKFEAIRLIYGKYPPSHTLTYIWANKAPKGIMVPNAYTDRVMMIAVESGPSLLNTWIHEKRHVADDFNKAFGKPPSAISGVAIMTDTDNTGEIATTWYGDIFFSPELFRK